VAVRAQIERHAVDIGREVRAMVEVEATQKILIGLAAAGMLDRDHPGNGLEQLGGLEHGPDEQVGARHRAFARRFGRPEQLRPASEDDDLLDRPGRGHGSAAGGLLGRDGERNRNQNGTDCGSQPGSADVPADGDFHCHDSVF
jgi:hypothetical protein